MTSEEEPNLVDRGYVLFPFQPEEILIVKELKNRIRGLLRQSDISAPTVRHIGTVLFALDRLPRSTPGVAVVIGPCYRCNNESSFCDFYISETEFRLSAGGNVYDPSVGSDSYSKTVFEIETSGYRQGSAESEEVWGWFSQFDELVNLGASIEIEYLGDDELVDWSDEGSAEFWQELSDESWDD